MMLSWKGQNWSSSLREEWLLGQQLLCCRLVLCLPSVLFTTGLSIFIRIVTWMSHAVFVQWALFWGGEGLMSMPLSNTEGCFHYAPCAYPTSFYICCFSSKSQNPLFCVACAHLMDSKMFGWVGGSIPVS